MLISKSGVPRLSPATIIRERLQQWMHAYAGSPLRLLVAPPGSGKSTVMLRYAHISPGRVAYCALPGKCTIEELYKAIAVALNSERVPATYDELCELISENAASSLELAIDDADNASPPALDDLFGLVEDVAPNVSLIYAGRSREALRCRSLVSRGVADLCDAKRLFFTAEEATLLAQSRGLEPPALDCRRLIDDTDGWAIAVAHTIRRAVAENETLTRALALWRAESQAFVNDLVEGALQAATEDDRKTFWNLYHGENEPDRQRLRDLEVRGLFVIDDDHTLRLYRPLRPADSRITASPAPSFVPPLMVKMFRSFEASIQGQEITWVRRRDQEIVKYLILKPSGSASREEIAEVFWPGADRHLATQSVRTACSTIRKALAEIVGPSAVDRYFRTIPHLQIDLDNVVSDVRRFTVHNIDAESAIQAGDSTGAEMHLRASYKLYRGRLLEFEGEKRWFATQAQIMHDRYIFGLECLGELALERGDLTAAHLYVSQARAAAPDRPNVVRLMERLSTARSATATPTMTSRMSQLQTV